MTAPPCPAAGATVTRCGRARARAEAVRGGLDQPVIGSFRTIEELTGTIFA
jgi:hypothetical protein